MSGRQRIDRLHLAALSLLAILTIVQFARLSRHHDFVPLWVEGMTEYQHAMSTLLGFRDAPLTCALVIGDRQIPLGVTAYVGGGFIFLHAPVVAAWFHGWTSDPYFFRYVGILAYLIDGWLIYLLALRFWDRRTAWWAAALWLTAPNLFFIAIADLQWELEPALFAMLSVLLILSSFERNRPLLFLSGCFVLGFVSTTRLDAFLLLIVCSAAYLLIVRPEAILRPAFEFLRRRWWILPSGILAVAAGALPLIVYNVICPWGRLTSFVNKTVIPYTFDVPVPLSARLMIRLGQFFDVNALHKMPFLEVREPNYVHAAAFVAAVIVMVASVRRWWITFPLLSLILIVPLSLLSTGVLRHEHMIPLQVLTTLLVASGLSARHQRVREVFRARGFVWLRQALLVAAVCGNLVVQSLDWKAWQDQPRDRDTILNQSAPVQLERYLRRFGPGDRVLFTNIGLYIYQQYLTADRFEAEEMIVWEGEEPFRQKVEQILREPDRRRVFVGSTVERDGTRFSMPRTGILLEVLDRHGVPYSRETLSTDRRVNLYEVVIVEKGHTIH